MNRKQASKQTSKQASKHLQLHLTKGYSAAQFTFLDGQLTSTPIEAFGISCCDAVRCCAGWSNRSALGFFNATILLQECCLLARRWQRCAMTPISKDCTAVGSERECEILVSPPPLEPCDRNPPRNTKQHLARSMFGAQDPSLTKTEIEAAEFTHLHCAFDPAMRCRVNEFSS